jgi:signal transduction histidine kinase
MSSKPRGRIRILQTLYVRFALLFFLTMIFASGILFGGTFAALYRSLQKEDEVYSQRRLLSYWARYQAGGIESLVESLRVETLIYDERPFFVRVATVDNSTIFLSYPEHWESFSIPESLEALPLSEFESVITLEDDQYRFDLEVMTIALDEYVLIQLGTSSERREAFLRLFQRNFLFFLTFMLLFGLAAGLFIAWRAVTPLRRLSTALGGIIRTGNLHDRLPVRGAGDELDELGELFNRLMERIEELIARMRETLDTVAHDLRTPLTRLRGGAELALQSTDPERRESALSDALEESDHILALLTSLMDVSEAESGILKLSREPVAPEELIGQVIEIYQFVADEREIRIDLGGQFPEALEADKARFRQVTGNLLDNAVKYSPDKGRILVRGSIEKREGGSFFRLCVENQGPAIAPEELPRIWDRLYRAAGNTAPGMGLGLSVVRAVIEAHGGRVEAENLSETAGVRFCISLPV